MRPQHAGFTLVELLLTLLVLVVGLTSLLALFPAAMQDAQRIRETERMERMADTLFATLQAGETRLPFPANLDLLLTDGTEFQWPGEAASVLIRPLSATLQLQSRTHQVVQADLQLSGAVLPQPLAWGWVYPESPPEWQEAVP